MHCIEHGDPFSSLFAEGWFYPAESLGYMVASLDKSVPPTQTGCDLVYHFLVTVAKHTRKGSKGATTSLGSRFQRVPHGHSAPVVSQTLVEGIAGRRFSWQQSGRHAGAPGSPLSFRLGPLGWHYPTHSQPNPLHPEVGFTHLLLIPVSNQAGSPETLRWARAELSDGVSLACAKPWVPSPHHQRSAHLTLA